MVSAPGKLQCILKNNNLPSLLFSRFYYYWRYTYFIIAIDLVLLFLTLL